jgi:hypothetical protein
MQSIGKLDLRLKSHGELSKKERILQRRARVAPSCY